MTTDAANILATLERAGVQVWSDGRTVRLRPASRIPPGLLSVLHEREREIVAHLNHGTAARADEFDRTVQAAIQQMNTVYPEGAITWIRENRPDLDREIAALEGEDIHRLWRSGRPEPEDLEQLACALARWRRAYTEGIDAFRSRRA